MGTRGCQAKLLEDFLKKTETDKLYLVGDIIDGWVMSRGVIYWPQEHTNVIRKILSMSKKGTEVIYITGNHDEFLRAFPVSTEYGLEFGNITVTDEDIHVAADGKEYLVVHGDRYDVVTRYHKWIAIAGDYGYRFLIWLNRIFNKWRQRFGKGYWSLSAFLKHKVKTAVNFIGEYENAVVFEARQRGVDGVICGHIHHAEIKEIDGFLYMNDGDWVESCTALVEDHDGNMSIIQWANLNHEHNH